MANPFSPSSVRGRSSKKDPMRYVFGSGMFFSLVGLILILGLILVLTNNDLRLAALSGRQSAEDTTTAAATAWKTAGGGEYSLTIGEQAAGTSVMIDALKFAAPGWVVFHADKDGAPGTILSAYRFNAGEVKNWDAGLIDGVTLEAGATYHAMVHAEDGDRSFSQTKDVPVLAEDGKPMSVMFTVKQ